MKAGWALVAAAVVLGVLLVAVPPPAQAWPMAASHYDSVPMGAGNFVETFRVTRTDAPWSTANLTVWVENLDLATPGLARVAAVTWAPLGDVAPGTTFSFPLASYDFRRAIEVRDGDVVVWRDQFGSGAGTPVL